MRDSQSQSRNRDRNLGDHIVGAGLAGPHDRLEITGTVEAFVEKISSRTAIEPITVKVAVLANQLPADYSGYPCDRLIGATALAEGIALVRKDTKMILDVFSRYVTRWTVAMRESADLAKRLIAESCQRQRIQPGQLTLHADHGTSVSSRPVAFLLLLADLGVTKTNSRPHVSNDNPYSKSQFRTLKYRPEFPDRFGCIQDSRAFCQGFFRWYNEEHRHSALGLLMPAMVHYDQTGLMVIVR